MSSLSTGTSGASWGRVLGKKCLDVIGYLFGLLAIDGVRCALINPHSPMGERALSGLCGNSSILHNGVAGNNGQDGDVQRFQLCFVDERRLGKLETVVLHSGLDHIGDRFFFDGCTTCSVGVEAISPGLR